MGHVFSYVFLLLAFVCVAIYVGVRDRRTAKKKLLDLLKASYGHPGGKKYPDGRYELIPRYLEEHPQKFMLDDITWNDLELDSIFQKMDITRSSAGEEYLYSVLRSPVLSEEDFAFSAAQYEYWDTHEEERLKAQVILTKLGRSGKYSIYDYLELLDDLTPRPLYKDLLCIALLFVSIGIILVNTQIGVLCLIGTLIYNMLSYYRVKGEIEPYLVIFRYILRMIRCAEALLAISSPAFEEELLYLKRHSETLKPFVRGSSVLMRGDSGVDQSPLSFLHDYLCIVTHADLIKFGRMLSHVKRQKENLDAIITEVGRIDASISIASYRKSLSQVCSPSVNRNNTEMLVSEMIHPLIEKPVPNSVEIRQPILMTGSNASGKSTFLKNVALCAVLAQTVGFVPAAKYEAPFFRIYTSMALRDNLLGGESYFIVEIRSLKRILDLEASNEAPVLCCIDEVLRGTNTIERISASTEILHLMAERGFRVLAATHDLELTELLQDLYENYHFSEAVDHGDVHFTYTLQRGPSNTRNAILLLGALGYDATVVHRATERAEHFMKTGEWREKE